MAKYDIHWRSQSAGYLLDCQADRLAHLNARFVVPLMEERNAPLPAPRLNPVLIVAGKALIMVTQFAAAVRVSDLGEKIGSCLSDQDAVGNALDMLISGF